MDFKDFFVKCNGETQHLNNLKHGIRKEYIDKKFHNIFDAYDINSDGTLEEQEFGGIFEWLTKFSGDDKTLDTDENTLSSIDIAYYTGIENADFRGFLLEISNAAENIVQTTEVITPDGGKEVKTTYKDGAVEIISYYPDGEYRYKKFDYEGRQTVYFYTIGDDTNTRHSEQEIEELIKDAYDTMLANLKSNQGQGNDFGSEVFAPAYEQFRQDYMQQHNINKGEDTKSFIRHDFNLSERAKRDIEIRNFMLEHYIETHKSAKEALESLGILDDIGAAINAGAGELWNSIKNAWKGSTEEYQNFYELVRSFSPHYSKAIYANTALNKMKDNPETYFSDFENYLSKNMGIKFDYENASKFYKLAEQYTNAQTLKIQLDILNKAMEEIRMYQSEQEALTTSPAHNEGLNPATHITNANKLLLQYFGGDQEAVNMILNGTILNPKETIKAITGILADTEKLNEAVLDGKTFEEIQNDYKTQYMTMYGTDFVPDELNEKVMDAKETAFMVKMAAITIVSILITKSPVMTEISAAAGGAEVSGAAANMIRSLVAKYGKTVVEQGIKLAMSSGTLATDAVLETFNRVTSESKDFNGYGAAIGGAAKYIFFGSYLGGPIAKTVSSAVGKLLGMEISDAVESKLVQFMKSLVARGSGFATNYTTFTGLDIATGDVDLESALNQGETFFKLELVNHVLAHLLGANSRGAIARSKNVEAALEASGVKDWKIREIKTSEKTQYVVDVNGMPIGKFSNPTELITAMLERITENYERDSFVAIREEIMKLPQGNERTRLMQAYLGKYREWASGEARPDVRMQYNKASYAYMQKDAAYCLNEAVPLSAIELPNGQIINLNDYSEMFAGLKNGEKIYIGRQGDIKIYDKSGVVAKRHLVVYREKGQLMIKDISGGAKVINNYSTNNNYKYNTQYNKKHSYPKIKTPKNNTFKLQKDKKYLVEPYENEHTSISLGGVICLDINSNFFQIKFNALKEGESFTVGSWEGNADYKVGSSNIGVSKLHLIVSKENGKMVITDKSTYGSIVINNYFEPVKAFDIKKMMGGGLFKKARINSSPLTGSIITELNSQHHGKWFDFELDREDLRIMAEFMNRENGKYMHIWNSTSLTDGLRNIDKLAIMVKTLRRLNAVDYYKNLGPNEWELVVNNCCNKTNFATHATLQYKKTSSSINAILSGMSKSNLNIYGPMINEITEFLNSQVINKKVRLYRGETYSGILSHVKTKKGYPLTKVMEYLVKKGASQYEINNFINSELIGKCITQERFMSTTFTPEFAEEWAHNCPMSGSYNGDTGAIRWDIYAPAGTKGAFVEDLNLFFNKAENEVILQRNSTLVITGARFDWSTKTWIIEATVRQDKIPQ